MKRKPDNQKGGSLFSVAMISLGLILYFIVFLWAFIFLIVFSGRMPKWLYFTLLFLYFAMLTTVGMVLYRRIELRKERALYGDEAFFAAHPREWKRELRRWKKSGAYHTVTNDIPAVLQSNDGSPLKQGVPYDELYYEMCPNALRRDLRRQRFFRRVRGRLTRTSLEPSPYERRLSELTQKFRDDRDANV